ncbi:glutathione S-transferase theta-3 isoform X1 [Ovis aries]|uniref:glutathione S-transferase theta-3 isoform X1 n=1 Tax=Ovis aries TaxID=9940 RepID=UPI0005FBBC4F|nr:glutathione S-transferase theta-3 isoform X1 [Ovis aries]
MGLELYLDLLSQPCRAVYIFAKKNRIPFELRTVDLLQGQNHSDEFVQVNPLRKVPALKDGDFTLAESVAILLYLARKYEAPDHWYPQDLQARARVDEYLSWQHTALRMSCTRAMWQKMMFPVFLGQRVPPETLANTLAELDRCLQLLEDKFLKDQDFLAGPHISVADLVAITELMHVSAVGQGGCCAAGYPGREPVHQLTLLFLAGGPGWVTSPLSLRVLICKKGPKTPPYRDIEQFPGVFSSGRGGEIHPGDP